jgi:hypothetical protein
MLDVYDLCTEELQEKLTPARNKFKEMEDRKLEEAKVGIYQGIYLEHGWSTMTG